MFNITTVTVLMFMGLLGIIMSYLLYKQNLVDQITGKEKKKIKRKDLSKEDRAQKLNDELNQILSTMSKKVEKSKRLEEGTGVSMGLGDKFQDGIVSTISNPYNNVTVINMFFIVAIFASAGLLSGVLLQNAAVAVSAFTLGIITPFSLINLRGMQRQMSMMKGNLSILMNHYPNYIDSETFEESLERTIANIDQNTDQCRAFRSCLNSMRDNNMPIQNALRILRKQLMADKYVNHYLDGVLRSEQDDKNYKETLNSLLVQFEYLVRQNTELSIFSLVVYLFYMGGLVGMIVVIAILKKSDPAVYKLLAFSITGQLTIVVIFTLIGVLGFAVSSSSKLVRLDTASQDNKGGDQ